MSIFWLLKFYIQDIWSTVRALENTLWQQKDSAGTTKKTAGGN